MKTQIQRAKRAEIFLGTFLDPIYALLLNNKFSRVSEKKIARQQRRYGLKKPFIREFTVKSKLAFFALTKKRRFSRPIFDPT